MQNKNQKPYDENGQRHGYWETYFPNGNLYYKGNYIHGRTHGYWEGYHSNGNLIHKGNLIHGKRDGYWEYYENGNLNYKRYYAK